MIDLFLTNSLHKTLIDGLEWCGLLVDYCDVLSAVWTLILTAPIYCRGSTGEQVKFCSFSLTLINKQSHLLHWMAWGWVNYQQMFIFIPLMIIPREIQQRLKLSQPALVSHTWSECQSVKRMRKEERHFKQRDEGDEYLNECVSIQVRCKSERKSRKLHKSIITNDLEMIRKEWKVKDREGDKISVRWMKSDMCR